jgi:hypothetical protein
LKFSDLNLVVSLCLLYLLYCRYFDFHLIFHLCLKKQVLMKALTLVLLKVSKLAWLLVSKSV